MTNLKRFLTLTLIATLSALCMHVWGQTTVSIADVASAGSWTNGSKHTSFTSGIFTFSVTNGGTNTGKYYTSNDTWRVYGSENGAIAITVSTSYKITAVSSSPSVTFTKANDQEWTYSYSGSGNKAFSSFTITYTTAEPSYTITAATNNATYGTVSLSGSVITATANSGYRINETTPYSVTSGTATVSRGTGANSNKFTVTPSSTCTVQINFEAIPTYAVRFFNNGIQVGATQNILEGGTAVKPSNPDPCDEGYTFVGWWTDELDEDNTTAHTWVTDFTVSGAQDYYAVFSKAGIGGGSQTFNFASLATANSWVDEQDGYDDITISPINISVTKGDANNWARWWNADKTWRIYNKNTVTISSPSVAITSVTSSPSQTFSVSAGVATLSPSSTVKFTSITVNYGTTYYTTDCGSTCSTPTLTFGVTEVNKFDGDAKFTYTATPGSTTLGPGTITYASSLPTVAEVNETTGEVTIHKAMSTSPVVITATMAKVIDGSDCQKQVKASYTLNVYHKVTWLVGGDEYTTGGPTTQTTEGGEIETFPTDPNGALVCDGKTFMGWTTSEYEGATAPATLYTNSSTVHITGNTTFHAVFAEPGGESEDTYHKGTSADLTDGKRVLIVNHDASYAMKGVESSYGLQATSVSISAGKITTTDESIIWTVRTGSSGYYFHQGDNYVNAGPDSESYIFIWYDESPDEWLLAGSGPYTMQSTNEAGYYMLYETGDFYVYTDDTQDEYTLMDFYVPDAGMTNFSTICCNEVETPVVNVLARSITATISWENQAGATSGYSVIVKQGESVIYTNTTLAAGTTSCEVTGLTPTTAYSYTVIAKGANCNRSYFGNFTTTSCEDVPYDIIITPALQSAKIKWTASVSTATVKVYSNEACTDEVASKTNASSPTWIEGLTENTKYYAKIWAGGTCESTAQEFTTNSTSVEIAEWFPDSIRINLDADAHASVIIEDKQEKQSTGSSKLAEKVFFAKYFEGEGNMKLISIYNGTDEDINLSTYSIVVMNRSKKSHAASPSDYDISGLGTIYKGQEIIFFSRPKEGAEEADVRGCSTSFLDSVTLLNSTTDNPRWIECGSGKLVDKRFEFNGDDGILLKENGTTIDCFGASSTDESAYPSANNCRSEKSWTATIKNMDYGKTADDFKGIDITNEIYGINTTDETITAYTARVILFRDSSVVSGMTAATSNTTSFATFASEWNGRYICASGTTGMGTCNSFHDIGVFNYDNYYATYEEVTKVDEIGGKKNDDGTYTIPIDNLDDLSCTMMRVKVYEGTTEKASREYKVPIMVEGSKMTDDAIFNKHEIPTCKECDVVILRNATLEKTNGANDRDEVRNMMIYPGGTLIVPSGEGDYTVQSIQFRVEKETAPVAKLNGNLITKDEQVIVSRRIKNDRYYFFSLPYDCNIADIRWSNGETPVRGVDYEIVEYDGERRAIEGSAQGAPGHWKPVSGTQLKAGVGYNIAVANEYVKELIFPMAIGSTNLTNEENTKTAKTVEIHQYTGSTTINNYNWNLVAHPYVSAFSAYEGDKITAGWLKYTPSGDPGTPGEWTRESTGSVYLTMPSFNAGAITYEQTVSTGISSLNPFLAVFVQGAGEGNLTFEQTGRKLTAPARHLAAKAEDEDESIFIGVTLSGNDQTDNTYLRVRQDFTDEYELGYDLEKFITFYTDRPQVYMKTPTNRLAFQALSDSAAVKMQPMGVYCYEAGTYTFSLNPDFPTDEIEGVYLYDAMTGITTNLLYDTYSFSSSKQVYTNTRFALSAVIRRRVAEQTTDLTAEEAEQTPLTRKILIDGHVYILRGGKVFDVTGKQLLNH